MTHVPARSSFKFYEPLRTGQPQALVDKRQAEGGRHCFEYLLIAGLVGAFSELSPQVLYTSVPLAIR